MNAARFRVWGWGGVHRKSVFRQERSIVTQPPAQCAVGSSSHPARQGPPFPAASRASRARRAAALMLRGPCAGRGRHRPRPEPAALGEPSGGRVGASRAVRAAPLATRASRKSPRRAAVPSWECPARGVGARPGPPTEAWGGDPPSSACDADKLRALLHYFASRARILTAAAGSRGSAPPRFHPPPPPPTEAREAMEACSPPSPPTEARGRRP